MQLEAAIAYKLAGGGSSFNSILVQLEVVSVSGTTPSITSFNSILVQLEEWTKAGGRELVGCFNSILVQLEVCRLFPDLGHSSVSIPYWCN